MKQYYLIIAFFLSFAVKAQIVNIPDAAFKSKLLSASSANSIARDANNVNIKIDINSDNEIQVSEALTVYVLNINDASISSMIGIAAFTNLEKLNCQDNLLTSLDVSANTHLTRLYCHTNNLTTLQFPNTLEEFNCLGNNLTSLNMSGFTNLTSFYCRNNALTSLNVSGTAITGLDCRNNQLVSLDISNAPALTNVNCSSNQLTSLTVNNHPHLQALDCSNNNLTQLNISNCNVLSNLNCEGNQLTALNLSGLNQLVYLYCTNNTLTTLPWSAMPNLNYLYCAYNPGIAIAPVGMSQLQVIQCNNSSLTTINLAGAPSLMELRCEFNNLTSLDLSAFNIDTLICNNNQLTSLILNQQYGCYYLKCQHNFLTTLDMPNVTASTSGDIDCSYNMLTSVNFDNFPAYSLDCSHNQLTSLAISNIEDLDCSYNMLSSLSIHYDAGNAEDINCSHNQLASFSITGTGSAFMLDCSYNVLTDFSMSITNIFEIIFAHNLFESIHLEGTSFENLACVGNPNLQALFVKNGDTSESFDLAACPMLQYICADPGQVNNLDAYDIDLSTIEINSYCTYTPGAFYDITGHEQLDLDNNGCSPTDIVYPNMHLDITNGVVQGTVIADTTGNYAIPVQAGTHTLTPVFETPYFTATPASVTVTFPTTMSPAVQNFCITPNGTHPDVEISVFNMDTAVPGFDASYRIVYKNKGTTTTSGAVSFSFDDDTLDFVSANPIADSQSTGLLSWNYTNLQPFETRTLTLTLNLNSPVETPPLNQDDVLSFAANISLTADENPADNTATLQQTVFNAFDPNDKTCLEGDTITPEMIGEYVHYKIRFENTGNFPAAIVTVKDVIDISKFDISTLTPIIASHPFITRITNTNQVEFVFDNIMLPFDDANNDGYVIFKIKTKPTLVLGDELSNTAGIYFNYNAPVITNTAVTTVALPLGIDGNENAFGFALYPNPVKDVLNISSKVNASIDSVIIYNTLGQEVMKVLPALGDYNIDVSKLSDSAYIVKVVSETGSWTAKFVKE